MNPVCTRAWFGQAPQKKRAQRKEEKFMNTPAKIGLNYPALRLKAVEEPMPDGRLAYVPEQSKLVRRFEERIEQLRVSGDWESPNYAALDRDSLFLKLSVKNGLTQV